MKVWLDDIRQMPEGFDCHVRTAAEAIGLLAKGGVTAISLDHDLGENDGTGYDVACWIRQAACVGKLKKIDVAIHSANPFGSYRMEEAIASAREFWNENNIRKG